MWGLLGGGAADGAAAAAEAETSSRELATALTTSIPDNEQLQPVHLVSHRLPRTFEEISGNFAGTRSQLLRQLAPARSSRAPKRWIVSID